MGRTCPDLVWTSAPRNPRPNPFPEECSAAELGAKRQPPQKFATGAVLARNRTHSLQSLRFRIKAGHHLSLIIEVHGTDNKLNTT